MFFYLKHYSSKLLKSNDLFHSGHQVQSKAVPEFTIRMLFCNKALLM